MVRDEERWRPTSKDKGMLVFVTKGHAGALDIASCIAAVGEAAWGQEEQQVRCSSTQRPPLLLRLTLELVMDHNLT